MRPSLLSSFALIALAITLAPAIARDKPAPHPSRYRYTLEFDAKSLPEGVKVRQHMIGEIARYFVKNTSDKPLIFNEKFSNEKLVAGEDPKEPLTDQEIVQILQKSGINIARRTVAKYREQLKVPSARMRKRV